MPTKDKVIIERQYALLERRLLCEHARDKSIRINFTDSNTENSLTQLGFKIGECIHKKVKSEVHIVSSHEKNSLIAKVNLTTNDQQTNNLFREYQILSNANHPQVPKSKQIIVTKDNTKIHIMDQVEGVDMSSITNKKYSLEEQIDFMCQIVDILDYFHDPKKNGIFIEPVTHLDVTPYNIISCGKKYHLIDFASAKTDSEFKMVKYNFGTDGFRDRYQEKATTTSDFYSLAMTTLNLFYPSLFNPRNSNKDHEIKPSKRINPELRRVLNTMISPILVLRYQSGAEIKKDLNKILK